MKNNYMPVTRACVTVIMSGVPLGVQIAWLSNSKTGIPLEVIRLAAVTHCAVIHGKGLPPGVVKGQPAIVYGIGCNTIGCLLTKTLGLGEVGCACPECAHSTVAPRCNKNPGIYENVVLNNI